MSPVTSTSEYPPDSRTWTIRGWRFNRLDRLSGPHAHSYRWGCTAPDGSWAWGNFPLSAFFKAWRKARAGAGR